MIHTRSQISLNSIVHWFMKYSKKKEILCNEVFEKSRKIFAIFYKDIRLNTGNSIDYEHILLITTSIISHNLELVSVAIFETLFDCFKVVEF